MSVRLICILCLLASFSLVNPASATTLRLLDSDPNNQTQYRIRVQIRDTISGAGVVAFDEVISLADGGSGHLEFDRVGIIEERLVVTEFGFAYDAGEFLATTIGTLTGDIPVSLQIDEVRFSFRNADGSSILTSLPEIGDIAGFSADLFEASLRGTVTLDGTALPFDLYDPVEACNSVTCIRNVNTPIMFLDAFEPPRLLRRLV